MNSRPSYDQRRLYDDLAWTWPIISPPQDYVEEAELFARVIREHAKIEVRTLLDLGCGGGHNDYTLKKHFQITGIDISEAMLGLARKLNPEVTYLVGDMRSARLERVFDAVMLHDSINYMTTVQDLRAAFVTAFTHLKPGGVLVTFVEQTPERFEQNKTTFDVRARDDVEITFIENWYDPDPSDTTYENTFIYLIRRKGQLEIHTDRHLGGIFPLETWLTLLNEIGFEVRQTKFEHSDFAPGEYYPMLVGIKPV